MLARIGNMRWIAALLVISVLWTLCGCHAGLGELVACILGSWMPINPMTTVSDGVTTLVMIGLVLAIFSAAMSSGVTTSADGNYAYLDTGIDTDGDGTADQYLNVEGALQRDGNSVTGTLTQGGVASASQDNQVELDLLLTGANTMAGTITLRMAGVSYSGAIDLQRHD